MDPDRAVAVYGVLVSLESYDIATREYGWDPEEVETWWHGILSQQLFD